MNNDTLQTSLRWILKLAAGYLIGKGITDESTAEVIIAGLMALAGLLWGIFHRSPPASSPAPSAPPLRLAVLLVVTCLAGVPLYNGCQSTPERVIYSAEASTQITVEAAMSAWGDYVQQFHPPLEQELAVLDAFLKYQSAAVVAVDAAESYAAYQSSTNSAAARIAAELARQAAAGRLDDLVKLLRTFGVKI